MVLFGYSVLFTCLCNIIKMSLFNVKFIFGRPICIDYKFYPFTLCNKHLLNNLEKICTTVIFRVFLPRSIQIFSAAARALGFHLHLTVLVSLAVSVLEVHVVGVHEDLMPSSQQEQASKSSRSCNSELLVKILEVNFCLFPFFAESHLFPLRLYETFF